MSHRTFAGVGVRLCAVLAVLLLLSGPLTGVSAQTSRPIFLPLVQVGGGSPATSSTGTALVFVQRQIPNNGSIYWDRPNAMPGVGAHSRFRPAAPGKLLVREPDGRIRTLIDGSNPTAASLNLMDVNAPDVSYDGTTIVFAGLPKGMYSKEPNATIGAWRLYSIRADGSGLRQITTSDMQIDLNQFGAAAQGLGGYDDTDPAWLPDGRIVFSSTRWPSFGHYSGARTTNLYVVKSDGTGMHRITSERNGADRPLVDPQTGKIVFARWWRNHRFPANSMADVTTAQGDIVQRDGLTTDRYLNEDMFRNAWQATTINPDGTDLAMWSGVLRDEEANHIYGGAFTPDGALIANFFPMYNMTEASGFGGLRRYSRGPVRYQPIIGITRLSLSASDYANGTNPGNYSYGIYKGSYAAEPDVLPDGRLVFSWAKDYMQDYGLYVADQSGQGLTKLYDNPGTSELRARALRPRPVPPIVSDRVSAFPSLLPPAAGATASSGGTFVFEDLNVYANAPVDVPIVNAPPVGSARTIRFFMDQQRTSPGSFPALDWPILLGELGISPSGALRSDQAPADVPLFEQIRSPDGSVPLTFGPLGAEGSAHVAGMNYGRPGEQVRCVGCHAGHSMQAVPATAAEAAWTNLATGASVMVSSSRDARYNNGLIDRQVMRGDIWRYWTSQNGQPANGQWVQLTFPVPVSVREVRLYNPRSGDEANSSIQVKAATVQLFSDTTASTEVARNTASNVTVAGTSVPFNDVKVRSIRITLDSVSGTFYGMQIAGLAEVEVIARAEAP